MLRFLSIQTGTDNDKKKGKKRTEIIFIFRKKKHLCPPSLVNQPHQSMQVGRVRTGSVCCSRNQREAKQKVATFLQDDVSVK